LDFFILELFNVKIENKKKTTFALYFIDFPQFIANSFKKKIKKISSEEKKTIKINIIFILLFKKSR
jgi:hypothetical protein